jgi:hypothetical protein
MIDALSFTLGTYFLKTELDILIFPVKRNNLILVFSEKMLTLGEGGH